MAPKSKKIRADQAALAQGLAADLKSAQALILAGELLQDNIVLASPGQAISPLPALRLKLRHGPYASRGGSKLAAALKQFGIQVKGLRCLDLGASTGGFTDALLKAGASKVYAVDSGFNQLDWGLRQDPRVISMEGVSALDLSASDFDGPIDFACADLSFISVTKSFPTLLRCLKPNAPWIVLVKPQFELEPGRVPKGGIVRSTQDQQEALQKVQILAGEASLGPEGSMPSPIKGRKGNIEFLLMGRIS